MTREIDKRLVYAIKKQLKDAGTPVKVSHIYELISVALGYPSHNDFIYDTQRNVDTAREALTWDCETFGYPASVTEVIWEASQKVAA